MELCSALEKETLEQLRWKHDLSTEQAEFVRTIVRNCGALDYSYKKAEEFAKQAKEVIIGMRENNNDWVLNEMVLDYLEGIAEYMAIKREA